MPFSNSIDRIIRHIRPEYHDDHSVVGNQTYRLPLWVQR